MISSSKRWNYGHVEKADCTDQALEDAMVYFTGCDEPVAAIVLGPVGTVHPFLEVHVGRDLPGVGHSFQVALKFIPGGMSPSPVVACVGKGIDDGFQVHLSTGVSVLPPGASDAFGVFEDLKVNALPAQRDCCSQATETGPDDCYAK
jgi:hypothetical protein